MVHHLIPKTLSKSAILLSKCQMNTIELSCIIHEPNSEKNRIADILVAQLSSLGFTGFLEFEEGLKAYIPEKEFDMQEVKKLSFVHTLKNSLEFHYQLIKEKNWNESWEKSFRPVIIEDKCIIRAPFHKPSKDYEYDIIIEPKMSFGTGHHSTTFLMLKEILNTNMKNKEVLDMGSGTGVLSILAEKKQAKSIVAIDKNDWAYKNALENSKANNCRKIKTILGDVSHIRDKKFDVILANINRNVLLQDIPSYSEALKYNGILLISGIYTNDRKDIKKLAEKHKLTYRYFIEKKNWIAIKFTKEQVLAENS